MVTAEQLRIFAERGYIVFSGVVPSDALEMARAEIARTVSADPPSSDHVGPCSYWPAIDDVHPFTGLLASDRVLTAAAYFRTHGADALLTAIPYPPVALPEPQQVHAQAGDLLLAHYRLAHNIGGNTGPQTRECIYYRLRAHGHRGRWRTVVQDSLLEFPAVRQREPADLG